MKTKRRLLSTILEFAGFFLFLIILATCDVGLGPSVDTNAPTVTITSPAASEVVSGQLEFRGDAKDDGTIKSVEIKFEGLGSAKGTDYTFYSNPEDTNARKVLVANKEWKLALDSTGNNLIEDGTYQLIVKVTDESAKCSESRTTFTVDNTAPVILVTSPDEKISTQNYDLQFEGKIYDATEIDDIIVTVFDEAGNPQVSKVASLSGTSEWKVTFNRDEPSSDLIIPATNSKISNGDYLYAVKASDKAGNASTYFFHKEDVYNCYNKNKLSIDKWAAFDKGTINWAELTQDSNDTTFSSVDNERTWLEGIRLPITPSSSGAGFNYSETQVMQITWTNIQSDTMLNTGDKIVGSITPPTGVDAPFRNDTFKCYISKSPFEIDPDSKTILSTPTVVASIETDSVNSIAPTYKLTNIGQSRSFSISTDALGGGTYYIYIEISNSSGSRYGATQSFSIDLSSPILTTNLTGQQVIKTSYDFKVEGTALISTGAIGCTLQYVVSVDGGEEQGPYYIHSVETDGDWDGNWELDLPNSDGTYSYTFTAVSGEYKTSKNYIIQLDTTEPEVEISSISQSNDAGDYIIATGTAKDDLSGLDKLEYSFAPENTALEDLVWIQENTKSLNSWNLRIPTASKDEDDYVLRVRLTDKAGWTAWRKPKRDESDNLITDVAGNVQYDDAELSITLDKHYPVLSVVINGTTTSTSEAERTKTPSEGWNFDSINPITGAVSDTHLEKLSVQFGDNTAITVTPETDGTWEWTPPANTNDGTYSVTVIAEDKVGKTAKINTTYTKDQFGPELEISTIETDGIYTKGNNEENSLLVKGTATDSPAGLKTISYLLNENNSDAENPDKSNPTKYTALSNKESKQNWEIKFPSTPTAAELAVDSDKKAKPSLLEGVNTLRIKAVDKSGNETYYPPLSEDPITFNTDYVRPTAYFGYTADNPETPAVESWNIQNTNRENTKNNIELTGMASDGSNTDGATIALSYSYVNASGVTVDTNVPNENISWDKTTGQWNWTFPVSNTTVNGTYTFKVSVTDIAGRTTSADHVVCVDTTPPIIDTGLSDDMSFKSDENWIAIRCRDEHTSLKSISWYLWGLDDNDHVYKYGAENEVSLSDSTTKITLPEGTDQKIKFVVEDIVGNVNEEEYTGITVDFNAPELKGGFASSAPKYLKNGSAPFKIITVTDDTVIAEDTIAVDSFTVTATKDETPQKNSDFGEFWYKKENLSGNQILASQLTDIPSFVGSETTGGNWVVTATVTDKSGWTASKTYSFTVDTIKPVVDTIEDIDAPKDMGTVSYMFSGTANDEDDEGETGSGVKEIWVTFTDKDGTPVESTAKKASGQTDWSYTLVFSDNSVFNTEGEKDIHVRAIDLAGNVGEWEPKTFLYDKSKPTSEITSYKNSGDDAFTNFTTSFFTGKSFTLKGKAYDSYDGIATVEVYQKIGTDDAVKIAEITDFSTFDGTPQEWTVSGLPRDPSNPSATYYHSYTDEDTGETVVTNKIETGEYIYYAIAMDNSGITKTDGTTVPGKTTTSDEITVKVDTTDPTVSITSPDNSKTGNNSLSGSSYIFSVDASDVGVGVDKIQYSFVKAKSDDFGIDEDPDTNEAVANPAKPDMPASWQATNGTITQSLASGVGTVAANNVCNTGTLNEGHWYLFVKSIDKAGNESDVECIHFHVDMKAPEIKNVTIDSETANENRTHYTSGSSFALAGTVDETYGIKSFIVTESYEGISDTDAEPHSVTPSADGSWNYTVDLSADAAKDKPVSVTLTATDNSGKTTTKNYTLYRDTVAPEVTAISPANKESLSTNKVKIKGSVVDNGSGTASVSYEIRRVGDDNFSRSGSGIVPTGESWKIVTGAPENPSDEIDLGNGEGTFILVVNAVDKVGNTNNGDENDTSVTTRTNEFYVDRANPKIKETGVNSASKMVKSYFTLSGYVYDSNALSADEAVVISADQDGFENISFKLPGSSAADAIEMTEASAEEKAAIGVAAADIEKQTWYKWTKTFCVGEETAGGTAADGTTLPADAANLSDGTYIFSITVHDVADKTDFVQRTITVDTRAPAFTPDENGKTIDYSGTGADYIKTVGSGDEAQTWFTTSVVSIKVTAGDSRVTDDANAEEGSGLSTVKYETQDGKTGFLMRSSEAGKENEWTTSIPLAEGTGNGIRIIAADAAGNETVYPAEDPAGTAQYETIRIDTKTPAISISDSSDLLTNGGETNQFTISGTAYDVTGGSGIASVTAKIGDTEYTMDTPASGENGVADDGTWSITFNTPNADESATTNRITSDGTYVITITAKDNAGLEKAIEKNVTVDTTPATFSNNAKINNKAPTSWFGTTSLDVTGSFTDANSIDSVQWSWESPDATNADGSPKAVWRSFDKSISGDSTTGYTCSFSGSVPAEKTAKKIPLYIRAIDKAGNIKNQTISDINIDLDYPTVVITAIDGKEPNGAPLVNGESDLPVTVEAKDLYATGEKDAAGNPKYATASGIKSVTLTIGTKNITGTKDGNTDKYNFNIAAADIESLGNIEQATITIKALDKVGKTSETSFKLKVDNTPPRAAITSPMTGDVLNKEVHFIGNANDENDLIIVNLYYSTATVEPSDIWDGENPAKAAEAARTKWVLFKTFEGQNGYNWDETIDTMAKDPADDSLYLFDYIAADGDGDAHIRFKAEAFDAANNSGTSTVTSCTINQLSDCPTITLNRVGVSGTDILKGSKSIDGTVSDDDGNISEIFVSNDNTTWEKLNIRNGSYWSYTYPDSAEDGWKTLYFKIKDKGCKENEFFYSKTGENGEDVLDGIYLTDGSGIKRMGSLTFCLDMNPPQIDEQKFKVYAHTGTNSASTYDNATSTSGLVLGGKNKYFDLYADVTDANGIASISVKAGGETINGIYAGTDNTKNNGIWRMNGIDLSKLGDGTQNLLVTAYDNTESVGTYTLVVHVDKTAPDFSIISHNSETEVTGDVVLRGMIENTGLSNAKSVKYMIPTRNSADSITADTDTTENQWHDMSQIEGTSTWQVEFTKDEDNQLKKYTGEGNAYSVETSANSNIWKVPVYIRTEDEVGNTKVYGKNNFFFLVNPDGDKPKASIIYPTSGTTLGGTVRAFGSAEDNEAVDAVYMQIDTNYDDAFDNVDKTALSGVKDSNDKQLYNIVTFNEGTAEEWWGIEVSGKESWNQTLNSKNEFGGTIRIRVRAVDNKGTTSNNWSDPITITIAEGIPLIGSSEPLRLVQYDDSGNEKASQDYQDDISIKGNWYLVGSAEFSTGIKELTATASADANSVLGSLQVYTGSGWGDFAITTASAPVIFRIPITTGENSGSAQFTISAMGNSNENKVTPRDISIKYDNTAPLLGDELKYNMSNVIGSGEDEDGDGVPDSVVIEQSNKTFSIEGTVSDSEGGSGFSRIAIYFKRAAFGTVGETGYKPERIYNPAIAKDDTGNCTNIDGSTVKLVDGLPTYTVTECNRSSEDKITLPGTLNPNIRKGGLVRIGGVYRLITGITGNTVTFTPSVSTDQKTAEFVFALVIDNFKIESPVYNDTTGALTRISNDDGDNVIESIEKNGSSYDWSISIDSKQIPDGSIDICCVAFDNAGNMSEVKTVGTKVFNNRPAIARIRLGTDYNGDGTVASTEFQSEDIYSVVLDKNGNWKKNSTTIGLKNASDFTAVGNTIIQTEVVGGNGTLNYYYSNNNSDYSKLAVSDSDLVKAYVSSGDLSTEVASYINGNNSTQASLANIMLKLQGQKAGKKLAGLGNGEHTYYVKIYDTTDNCTGNAESIADNDSQWASFAVKFNVKVVDAVPPIAEIKPFYWKGNTDNSLYLNSTANGHIELPGDFGELTENGTKIYKDSTGLYDKDPKVSGVIRIKGTAFDETRLDSIQIKVDGFAALSNFTEVSKFNGSWSSVGNTVKDRAGNVIGVELNDAGYGFFVTDEKGVTSTGHEVKWELDIDTSKITGVAALDKAVSVKIFDADGNPDNAETNASGGVVLENDNPKEDASLIKSYRMDIVPYIVKVYTRLATLKKNNWSVYNRTSLGNYPVASDETIYMYGFNLGDSTNKPMYGEVTLAAPVKGDATPADNANYSHGSDYANYQVVTFPVSNVSSSGKISIKVSGVESLNNKNGNDSFGDAYSVAPSVGNTGEKSVYDNFYNRQPNGDNNNLLTDDLVLDVWQINSKVAKPAGGALTQPVMAINPVNGQVGFAFRNGALMMSMGSQDYSYDYWLCGLDVWTSIGFAYDDLGYGWGTAAGGDINNSSADSFALLSSRWGTGTLRDTDNGHNNGTNQIRPYTIGQKDYDDSNNSFVNIDKERFQSSSLATTVNVEDNASTVYLAYYDNINNEIRFHWGTFTTNTKTAKMVQDLFSDAYGKANALNGKDITNDVAKYRLDYTSLIAGQTQNTHPYTGTPTDTRVFATDGTPVCAGQYVSIAALRGMGNTVNGVADDAVVAVWYDSTNNQMLYSYNKAPKSIAAGKFLQADTGWSKPVPIFGAKNGIGEYCKVALAKDGSAHVVAYDNLNADVVYAYVPSFDAPGNAVTCVVDSYGLVGTELDIDVALSDAGTPLPYISYYAGSNALPKTARWSEKTVLSATTLTTGAENEVFTGAWDISLIPTSSRISVDHINVGIWKSTSTGKIINSTTGENKTEQTGSSYTSSVSRGKIFGNGSKNQILGYAITEGAGGFIETAQMK